MYNVRQVKRYIAGWRDGHSAVLSYRITSENHHAGIIFEKTTCVCCVGKRLCHHLHLFLPTCASNLRESYREFQRGRRRGKEWNRVSRYPFLYFSQVLLYCRTADCPSTPIIWALPILLAWWRSDFQNYTHPDILSGHKRRLDPKFKTCTCLFDCSIASLP